MFSSSFLSSCCSMQCALNLVIVRPCLLHVSGCLRYLFSLSGVAFHATPGALKAVAQIALTKKTGARGLRTILEKVLMETMFVVPSSSSSTSDVATPLAGDFASSSSSSSLLSQEEDANDATTTNPKGAVTGVYLDAAAVRGDRAPLLTRHPMTLDAFVAAVSAQQQQAAATAATDGGGSAGGGGGGPADGWESDCEAYAIALASGESVLPPGVELVHGLVNMHFCTSHQPYEPYHCHVLSILLSTTFLLSSLAFFSFSPCNKYLRRAFSCTTCLLGER